MLSNAPGLCSNAWASRVDANREPMTDAEDASFDGPVTAEEGGCSSASGSQLALTGVGAFVLVLVLVVEFVTVTSGGHAGRPCHRFVAEDMHV